MNASIGHGLPVTHRAWTFGCAARSLRAYAASATSARSLRALATVAGIGMLGQLANQFLECQTLRSQAALATGALACTAILAERWAADADRIGRGCLLATLAGLVAAGASLV
jgi:hypothetical protein